jgi:tetratricopeptide (TPR) repeat protein
MNQKAGAAWYGDYLSIKGRHPEALAEARQALQIDPLNLMIGTWLELRYYLARDYNRAIESRSSFAAGCMLARARSVHGFGRSSTATTNTTRCPEISDS